MSSQQMSEWLKSPPIPGHVKVMHLKKLSSSCIPDQVIGNRYIPQCQPCWSVLWCKKIGQKAIAALLVMWAVPSHFSIPVITLLCRFARTCNSSWHCPRCIHLCRGTWYRSPLMVRLECKNLLFHVFLWTHPHLPPGFHFFSGYSSSSCIFSHGPGGENVV